MPISAHPISGPSEEKSFLSDQYLSHLTRTYVGSRAVAAVAV